MGEKLGADQFAYGDLDGDRNTIHGTGHLDVEVDADGHVVAVWFRCMLLPFQESRADASRAADMRGAYAGESPVPPIHAIVIPDPRR